jgi:hypothetical protein
MLSILLDIEWLLSTLFDASLLTFEPPATAAPFFCCPVSGQQAEAAADPDRSRPDLHQHLFEHYPAAAVE